jgi:hypothetical protein
MTASKNKQILQDAFAELSRGNSKPCIDLRADDISWTIAGCTEWSKTYRGKQAVLKERPLDIVLYAWRATFCNKRTRRTARLATLADRSAIAVILPTTFHFVGGSDLATGLFFED